MTAHQIGKNWHVKRQTSNSETFVCAHRFEWMAQMCASRRTLGRENRSAIGVFYTVRSAVIS